VRRLRLALLGVLLLNGACATAETGAEGWLRYAPIQDARAKAQYSTLPDSVISLDKSPVVQNAANELVRGAGGMLGRKLRVEGTIPGDGAFVLGTVTELRAAFPRWNLAAQLRPEGYALATVREHGHTFWLIAGADARGVLYGTFRLLQEIAEQHDLRTLAAGESPSTPVRWVDEWDNLNGSIERGYAGRSIFFDEGNVRSDLTRAGEYARLLASVGINGCTINNVNADLKMLTPEMIRQVARVADVFRPWGVRLAIAVDLSSPKVVGGLDTFDPLDAQVIAWWKRTSMIYMRRFRISAALW
jgi:alpha-glucuronidase